MRYTHDGLSLWTGTPDAPATVREMVVGVSPAHPSNAVEVLHRVNGGREQVVRARPMGVASPSVPSASAVPGAQYFRAVLPAVPPGGTVTILPTLLCAGRRCPAPGAADPITLLHAVPAVPTSPVVLPSGDPPKAVERFGYTMEFLGTVWVTLRAPPEIIGEVPQGLRVNYYITDGGCEGPRINAKILPEGADWMLIQRDGVAFPGVRTTWQTTDGALLYGEYSGVFDLGPDGYANAVKGRFPKLPVVQLAPRFVTSDPRYLWLNRKQCIGVGAVQMDLLRVEYDLYATGTGPLRG